MESTSIGQEKKWINEKKFDMNMLYENIFLSVKRLGFHLSNKVLLIKPSKGSCHFSIPCIWNFALWIHLRKINVFVHFYSRVQQWANFNLIIHHTKHFPTQKTIQLLFIDTATNTSCKVTNYVAKRNVILSFIHKRFQVSAEEFEASSNIYLFQDSRFVVSTLSCTKVTFSSATTNKCAPSKWNFRK